MIVSFFYKIESLGGRYLNKKFKVFFWYILKYSLNALLPFYYKVTKGKVGVEAKTFMNEDVIISLTTFPERMKKLPIVLESLLRQTVKADRIILWLADSQFPNKKEVENQLSSYINRGIEIRYCDDLRSHKKYYYTMKEYPNSYIVTVDDDILYPENMLQRLLASHQTYPDCIVTQRAHEMLFNGNDLLPYSSWNHLAQGCISPSLYLCQTGGSGCLYPPAALDERVFDISLIQELCPTADDLWLKTMSFLKGTKVVLTGDNNPENIDVFGNRNNGLAKINVGEQQNDKQLKAMTDYFNICWSQYL